MNNLQGRNWGEVNLLFNVTIYDLVAFYDHAGDTEDTFST